jgi:ABC-2 type transport system permease protein
VKNFFLKLRQRYHYSIILLKQLVKTDFKLRYQNSFLGYLWSLLRPLALFLIMYIVFVKFLKVNYQVPHSAVYLLVGLVVWNYFGEVTSGSIGAIVGRGDLLRKLNFPKYTIVLAGSFSALINLAINLVVVGIFMVVQHVSVGAHLLFVPLLIVELFVFAIALAFFLSSLYVKFRDVNYIWEVIMQAAFYATPIFYPLVAVPTSYHLRELVMLNPLAQVIQDMRYCLVTNQSPTISSVFQNGWIRLVPIGMTVLLAVTAGTYFRRRSRFFAEEI